ncbi:cold-shock protein [Acetobacter vaccinii]|nr:cold-shock protein [Acetobacter vaccinii]
MKSNRTDRSPRFSRRGGFDDDYMPMPSFGERPSYGGGAGAGDRGGFAPRRSAGGPQVVASGPEVGATVKWFNGEKGFGFVELADGSGDVFLHANALSQAGVQGVNPGATLVVRIGQGPKGRQVAEVISVDESTAQPERPRAARPGFGARPAARPAPDVSGAEDMRGTVKWYNAVKGFGFITPEGGGKDIFIHASALERSGLNGLNEGQGVNVKVVQGQKGPEAAEVTSA